jgi:Holliday junction DNA helicase RuvA
MGFCWYGHGDGRRGEGWSERNASGGHLVAKYREREPNLQSKLSRGIIDVQSITWRSEARSNVVECREDSRLGTNRKGGSPLLTKIRGVLESVSDETAIVRVDPFEFEIQIPEHTRRQIQTKLGEPVAFYTIFTIEGGSMAARLTPRLVGFSSEIDRQFFEIFCSVDGVGMRKALRAMVRPVRELARLIQDQDIKQLSTFPGIGEAMAERIVAKLRRKVGIFTLIVEPEPSPGMPRETNGLVENAEPDVIRDTYAALLSVGHSESQAREAIDRVLAGKKKYKSVPDMIEAIYIQSR